MIFLYDRVYWITGVYIRIANDNDMNTTECVHNTLLRCYVQCGMV